MALNDAQKTDVRRHCGYAMFGDTPSQMFGYRFMTHYGTLEYRLLHLSPSEETLVVEFITDCTNLEAAVLGSGDNLDTNKAAVWERNPKEIRERQNLYRWSRNRLCQFLGVPLGPGVSTPGEMAI